MTSIRILHLADLHIGMENYGQIDPATGLNGRVMDFLRRSPKRSTMPWKTSRPW